MSLNKYNSNLGYNFKHLKDFINIQSNICVKGTDIFLNETDLIGRIMNFRQFSNFIKIQKNDSILQNFNPKPKDTIFLNIDNIIYILDYRYQQVAGSVDEKLQTCDFKKKQYKRLLASLNFEVEYIYILNDWFKKPEYKDVLAYIHSVGCDYYFNYIPLQRLGLPIENS